MANRTQNYKNHFRFQPVFHFVVLPIFLVNFIIAVRHLIQIPSSSTAWDVVIALNFFLLAIIARVMALSVQDRVIRLEMRLRLQQILPPDLRGRILDLTPRQLVCMRFADDQEMPELMREILAGKLRTLKEMKLAVKNWQGDFLRA